MQDRRKRKSRNALKRALFELINKKTYSKITVSELCDIADVNRSTFYANYEDINNLLSEIHKDLFDAMMNYASIQAKEQIHHEQLSRITLEKMIEYIENNKKNVQILFKHSEHQLLKNNMVNYFMERYYGSIKQTIKSYPFAYHTMAFFSILDLWVKDDFPCTAAELADLISTHSEPLYKLSKIQVQKETSITL